ncbi:MAG TPA: hypothetical protein VF756_11535 [Thermoanaerobaculia bacterium]
MTSSPTPRAPAGHLPAWLLLAALAAGAYLAGLAVPYRVDTDTGFQLRSLQQWTAGDTPDPGTLRLPDPRDLSRDALVWSSWWPPGFPFLYAPLAATSLSLADALRAASALFFFAGAAGWLRLAGRLGLSPGVRLLYAASLAAYAATLGGAASLRSADLLAFAGCPWLVALALRLGEAEAPPRWLALGGLALGASYWLKYSLFLAALALAAWIALRAVHTAGVSRAAALRLAALGLGFALPVAALFVFNLRQSGSVSESASGTRAEWQPEETVTTRPTRLVAGVAGAPGLALFQSHTWITHLVYFSDARLPFFRGLSVADRLLAKSLLGIPGTAALVWGLVRARRLRPGPAGSLGAALPAGFYLALTAISIVIGYNYLANEPRLAAGFMPFSQLLALAGWLAPHEAPRPWRELAASILALSLFFVAPLAFIAADFGRNEVLDRLRPPYTASATGLYVPEISPRDVPAVRAAVASAMATPRDVVVLAGPAGWGSSFVMWLESPGRTLPVSTFFLPLGGLYMDAADLRSTRPLTTSRDLGVALVVADSLLAEGWLPRLQARFPQARTWRRIPVPDHSGVAVWRGDLEAP